MVTTVCVSQVGLATLVMETVSSKNKGDLFEEIVKQWYWKEIDLKYILPTLRNNLPVHIRASTTLESVKTALKTHLFKIVIFML